MPMQPSADDVLLALLDHDILTVLLAPPRVPSFAAETVPPPAARGRQ